MAKVPFQGYVLEKPRVSNSNDPFTSEPDTYVFAPSVYLNAQDGLKEYLVFPETTGSIVPSSLQPRLRMNFVRNDEVKRFGFNETQQRWLPLTGSTPDLLGQVQQGSSFFLAEVSSALDIRLGNAGATPLPIVLETDPQNWPPTSIPAGSAIVLETTGETYLSPDLESTFLSQPIYQFRQNFFDFQESTGYIGKIGQDDLYLNPIPQGSERALLRAGYGEYIPTTLYTVNADGSVDIDSSYDGEDLFYDGVVMNSSPIPPYTPIPGTLIPTLPYILTPWDLSVPKSIVSDPEIMIFYNLLDFETISEIKVVEDLSSPHLIPPSRVEVLDSGSTWTVRFSSAFVLKYAGQDLAMTTGEYDIENGINLRMFKSDANKDNISAIPDARATSEIDDEILLTSVPQGPFVTLPQIPLTSLSGYDSNEFFELQRGARRVRLKPDENVVYDFANRQLRWAERVNSVITIRDRTAEVKLPHQVLLNRNATFEADFGQGYQPLTLGQDVEVDFDVGQISFIKQVGPSLSTGLASTSGSTLTSLDTTFNFTANPSLDQAYVVEVQGKAYRILSNTSNTLLVEGTLPTLASVPFEVFETPQLVFDNSLKTVSLNKTWVQVTRKINVQTGSLVEVRPSDYFQDSTGTPLDFVLLRTELLGKLPDSIVVPTYFLDANANFDLKVRDITFVPSASPTPPQGAYYLDGAGNVTFNVTDLAAFDGEPVFLEPHFSPNHSEGKIEVIENVIGLPASVNEALLYQGVEGTKTQNLSDKVFLTQRASAGDQLEARFTDTNGDAVEGDLSFPVTLKATVGSGLTEIVLQGDVDSTRAIVLRSNGKVLPSTFDASTNVLTFESSPLERDLEVTYFVTEALGSETLAYLPSPAAIPAFELVEGSEQVAYGDWTSDLVPSRIVIFDDKAFEIASSSYDLQEDITTFELQEPNDARIVPTLIQVATKSVTDYAPVTNFYSPVAPQSYEVRFFGQTSIAVRNVLKIQDDPYVVTDVSYNAQAQVTSVVLGQATRRAYDGDPVQVSRTLVYEEGTSQLFLGEVPKTDRTFKVWRKPSGQDLVPLEPGVDFRVRRDGAILLSEGVTTLPKSGDLWYASYTAENPFAPMQIGPSQVFPKIKAQYTRFIGADTSNGIAGATLRGKFTYHNPDTFYFRVVPLEDYAGEVASAFEQEVLNSGSSFGSLQSFGTEQPLWRRGSQTLVGFEDEAWQQDRVAMKYLEYYQQVIGYLEGYLQLLDGRVIGEADGQFRFEIQADNTRGGFDPVTGRLIPRYATGDGEKPDSATIEMMRLDDQKTWVTNSIDDLVLTSKKPYSYTFPTTFTFEGTFQEAWEPSRLSRFYPQEARVAFTTPPSLGGGSDYNFLDDFRQILGDLQQENVLSISSLQPRSAQGWVQEERAEGLGSGQVRIFVGMRLEPGDASATNSGISGTPPNLEDGDPDRLIPGFKQGDLVSLGRVEYVKDSGTGVVTRNVVIYAKDMEIAQAVTASSDAIVLKEASDIVVDGNPIPVDGDNPTILLSNPPKVNDTLFVTPKIAYRQTIDYSLEASEGEVLNNVVPDFLAAIIGQETPDPSSFLEATITFKNSRTEPKEFPALLGGFLDDDGLNSSPYSYPLPDSEAVGIPVEVDAWNVLENDTTPGIVDDATLSGPNVLTFQNPLTNSRGDVPSQYDPIYIEGIIGNFGVSEIIGNDVFIAVFSVQDGSVTYTLDGAYFGSGARDSGNTSRFNVSEDFTGLAGLGGTLNIGPDSYNVTTFANGYIEVDAPIIGSGTQPFNLDLAGTGFIDSDLHLFKDAQDFSVVQGGTLNLTSGFNSGTYTVDSGSGNALTCYPPNISPSDVGNTYPCAIELGAFLEVRSGAVDIAEPTKIYLDQTTTVRVGQKIRIGSNSPNGGVYFVFAKDSDALSVSPPFRASEGTTPFPGPASYSISVEVINPRRASEESDSMIEVLAQRRMTYQDPSLASADIAPFLVGLDANNPSAPSQTLLEDLITAAFGLPVVSEGDGVVSGNQLSSANADFSLIQNADDAYVLITSGDSRGSYRVAQVLGPNDLDLIPASDFPIGNLSNEAGLTFQVFESQRLSERTFEIILYEYVSVLNEIDRIDDNIRLLDNDYQDLVGRKGDPEDSTIQNQIALANSRLDWILNEPSLRTEIETILASSDDLYRKRLLWIDQRINLETGLKVKIRQRRDQVRKARAKRVRDILKLRDLRE